MPESDINRRDHGIASPMVLLAITGTSSVYVEGHRTSIALSSVASAYSVT